MGKLRSIIKEELAKALNEFNRYGHFEEGDIIDYNGSHFRVIKDMEDYVVASSMEVFYGDENKPAVIMKTSIGRKVNEAGDMFTPTTYKPEFNRVSDLDAGGIYQFDFTTSNGENSISHVIAPETIGKYGSFTIKRFLNAINGFDKVLDVIEVKKIF